MLASSRLRLGTQQVDLHLTGGRQAFKLLQRRVAQGTQGCCRLAQGHFAARLQFAEALLLIQGQLALRYLRDALPIAALRALRPPWLRGLEGLALTSQVEIYLLRAEAVAATGEHVRA